MAEERYSEIVDLLSEYKKHLARAGVWQAFPEHNPYNQFHFGGFPLKKGYLVHSFSINACAPQDWREPRPPSSIYFFDNYGNIYQGQFSITRDGFASFYFPGLPEPQLQDYPLTHAAIDAIKQTFTTEMFRENQQMSLNIVPLIQYINSLEHPAPPVNMGPPVNRTKQGGARRAKHTRRRSRK